MSPLTEGWVGARRRTGSRRGRAVHCWHSGYHLIYPHVFASPLFNDILMFTGSLTPYVRKCSHAHRIITNCKKHMPELREFFYRERHRTVIIAGPGLPFSTTIQIMQQATPRSSDFCGTPQTHHPGCARSILPGGSSPTKMRHSGIRGRLPVI